jgi:hypothetical protein
MNKNLLAILFLGLTTACGSSNEHGKIALLVTDAPVPFESVHSATVQIDRITIDGGPYALLDSRTIYEGEPISIELCSLRNGAVRHILSHNLPLFTYRRMHVHFSGAELVLSNGRVFTTADGSLQLPHAGADGLEVTIATPVTIANEKWSRLLLDFDVPRSFVPQGTGDMLQAQSVRFDPLMHVVRPGNTGEIRGIVSQLGESGELVPVRDATLFFLPAGTEDLNMASASTASDADGSFAQLGLLPGTYDVVATKGGAVATYSACLVSAPGYTVVDLSLP